MRTIVQIALILLLHQSSSAAQGKEDYTWVFGTIGDSTYADFGGISMNFKTGAPMITTFNSIDRYPGQVAISDQNGDLLMYTSGCELFNKNGEVVQNGTNLNASGLSFICGHNPDSAYYYRGEVCMFLPWPKKENKYILIQSSTQSLHSFNNSFIYATIEQGIGNGIISVLEKQVPWITLEQLNLGKLTATRHANGTDWWVIAPKFLDSHYFISLFDSTGLQQAIQKEVNGGKAFTGGSQLQSAFSPDGNYYINCDAYTAQLFNFDRCKGELYHPQTIFNDTTYVFSGVEFSHDSRFFYMVQNNQLFQYDLSDPNFVENKILIGTYDGYRDEVTQFQTGFWGLSLAPDNKIYMSTAQGINVHVIHYPDRKGAECEFIQHQFKLPKLYLGLPQFPHYRTPAQVPACDQLIYDSSYCNCRDTLPIARKLSIYPNPALEYVEVSGPPGTEVPLSVEIYDALGRLLIQQHFTCLPGRVSVSDLPAAGYFYRIVGADGNAIQESTLVKVNR